MERRALILWTVLFGLVGLSCLAQVSLPASPYWKLVVAAGGLAHAATLAMFVIWLAAVFRRVVASAAAACLTVFVAADGRTYSLVGQHITLTAVRYMLEERGWYTLGLRLGDVLQAAALLVASGLMAWWAFRPSSRRASRLHLSGALAAALVVDFGLSTVTALGAFRGVASAEELGKAMPLSLQLIDDEILSDVWGSPAVKAQPRQHFPRALWRAPHQNEMRRFAPPTQAERRPDILMVVVESLRADAASKLPNLQAFARSAIVLGEHRSAGNCTFLGNFSLHTGLAPCYWRTRGAHSSPVGLAALHALGYDIIFTHSAALDLDLAGKIVPPGAATTLSAPKGLNPVELDEHNTEQARSWIAAKRARPSVFVLFYDASHYPYWFKGEEPRAMGLWGSLEARVADSAHRYDKSLREVDERLGRVLAAIDENGKREQLAVIVTGDHGEAMSDRGLGHGERIDDEQLRVPLVMRLPGISARQLTRPSLHQDVLPTVLAYMKAEPLIDGPGFGRNLLGEENAASVRIVGSYGVDRAAGYGVLLGDKKVLLTLGRRGARFVGVLVHSGELTFDKDAPEVRAALRAAEESCLAAAEP